MKMSNVKDAGAVGLLAGTAALFGLAAKAANDDALSNAGFTAVRTAIVVAPVAGTALFTQCKMDSRRQTREQALEYTVVVGGLVTVASAAVGGLARLAWDFMRA